MSPQAQALGWLELHPEFPGMPSWHKHQLLALGTLYHARGGDSTWPAEYAGWLNPSVHECQWPGDTANFAPNYTSDRRYQRLKLDTDGLYGELPPEISLLTYLTSLSMWSTDLVGSIPTEVAGLTSLTFLSFGLNSLTGSIPSELSALTNLDVLSLYGNMLTGTIPADLEAMTRLHILWLQDNFLNGTTPIQLCDLHEFYIDCDRVDCTCRDSSACSCY